MAQAHWYPPECGELADTLGGFRKILSRAVAHAKERLRREGERTKGCREFGGFA